MPMLCAQHRPLERRLTVQRVAGSYGTLLLTRLPLGAVAATAGPAIASLTGDYFPRASAGSIYAYILGGEIAGTAVGFIVSSSVASLIDWRAAFVLLAIPGFFLARELWRTVPEPLRGGQSRLEPGVLDLHEAAAQAASNQDWEWEQAGEGAPAEDDLARQAAEKRGVEPDPDRVLTEDPARDAAGSRGQVHPFVPTNVQPDRQLVARVLLLLGTLDVRAPVRPRSLPRRPGDAEVGWRRWSGAHGRHAGQRPDHGQRWCAGDLSRRASGFRRCCYLGPGRCSSRACSGASLTPALWFDVAGAALLSAANPPLDAARLDIMPAGLWGRAESVRTFLRSLAQALAPLVFGGLSQLIAGIVPLQTPIGTHAGGVSPSEARGLEISFLILLVTLFAAGLFLARARFTYAEDVATAGASQQGGERSRGAVADGAARGSARSAP